MKRVPKLNFSIISGGGSGEKGDAVLFTSGNKSDLFCLMVAIKLFKD